MVYIYIYLHLPPKLPERRYINRPYIEHQGIITIEQPTSFFSLFHVGLPLIGSTKLNNEKRIEAQGTHTDGPSSSTKPPSERKCHATVAHRDGHELVIGISPGE